MRLFVCVVVLLVLPFPLHAEDRFTPRPVDSVAAEVLAGAIIQSSIVRGLISTLESSNVLVHIESSRSMPLSFDGMTRFVVSRAGYRYLRITISANLAPRARTAILAHELQHAVEVAQSDADCEESLRRLFDHAGHRSGEYFETQAAIEVEREVRMELRSNRTRQATHAAKFEQ